MAEGSSNHNSTESKSKNTKKKVQNAIKKTKIQAASTKDSHTHPSYSEMVVEAISNMKERTGSSRQAIFKYIKTNFEVGENDKVINGHLKMALKRAVENHVIKHAKGSGATGSFRIGEKAIIHTEIVPAKKTTPVKSPKAKPKAATKSTPTKASKAKTSKKSPTVNKSKKTAGSPIKPKKVIKAKSPKKPVKKAQTTKKRR